MFPLYHPVRLPSTQFKGRIFKTLTKTWQLQCFSHLRSLSLTLNMQGQKEVWDQSMKTNTYLNLMHDCQQTQLVLTRHISLQKVADTDAFIDAFQVCQIESKKPSEGVEQHKQQGRNMALPQSSTALIGSTSLFIGLHLGHVLPPILERSTTVV